MALLKRTYALPRESVEQFEQVVPAGSRSAVISKLLTEWIEEKRREVLRREIIDGCREMTGDYRQIEQEYHALEEEVERALDA